MSCHTNTAAALRSGGKNSR